MPAERDARRGRVLLVAGLATAFVLSALRDPVALGLAALVAIVVFHRGAVAAAARLARSLLPVTVVLSVLSVAWLRALTGAWPPLTPFLALLLRVLTIGFVSVSVLGRVDLLRVLAPFPTLTRLLVVTLAQIHALRLLVTESREGLRSRMPRAAGVLELARNAGGITAVLFTLASRNAREIGDAMRSRGFE
jgi:cobalt/nickel transport system permease protein